MLKILSRALGDINKEKPEESAEDILRVSMAALLIHAGRADGFYDSDERDKVAHLLQTRFSLTRDECHQLLEKGEAEDKRSVDLYGFTKSLTDQLDQDGRRQFVKMMWEVILADGEIDDFESHLIWRVSDLLGVSTRDRVHLRQEVESEQK